MFSSSYVLLRALNHTCVKNVVLHTNILNNEANERNIQRMNEPTNKWIKERKKNSRLQLKSQFISLSVVCVHVSYANLRSSSPLNIKYEQMFAISNIKRTPNVWPRNISKNLRLTKYAQCLTLLFVIWHQNMNLIMRIRFSVSVSRKLYYFCNSTLSTYRNSLHRWRRCALWREFRQSLAWFLDENISH